MLLFHDAVLNMAAHVIIVFNSCLVLSQSINYFEAGYDRQL